MSGTARVIDGDTISIADTRIRLWGIDAPERERTCLGKYGIFTSVAGTQELC